MKTDLKDVTILILLRLDSIQRLENVVAVTDSLCTYFDTHINLVEASSFNSGMVKRLINKKINYQFIEDKDPILYKTRHFNSMMQDVTTPYIAIWDADVVVDQKAVFESITMLRNHTADVAYPYNGKCYNTSEILRTLFLKRKNIRTLYRHTDKMDLFHNRLLNGGAVFADREKYISAGMENEKHYGWGDDDFDRFYRFERLGFSIHRVDTCLFHLSHPRAQNSSFSSSIQKKTSSNERFKTESSSKQEILDKFSCLQ
ncbi:MAG: hypothetical protein LBC84_08455 [Prevotellaceae bacterium]|jgi:hypothetical protein|nr:hypothetical protein [Prevotellaceae bacterium]